MAAIVAKAPASGAQKTGVRLQDSYRQRDDLRVIGEALRGASLGNYWKYRVGDWRIICDIQDARIVVRALRLRNRREIYR